MLKHFAALWKPIALAAVFVIIVTLAVEFFVPLSEWQRHLLELIDLAAITVLAIDLSVHFLRAKEKKAFLKENWLLITSLFPFTALFRALRAIRLVKVSGGGWLSKLFHVTMHSPRLSRLYRAIAFSLSKAKEKSWLKRKKPVVSSLRGRKN